MVDFLLGALPMDAGGTMDDTKAMDAPWDSLNHHQTGPTMDPRQNIFAADDRERWLHSGLGSLVVFLSDLAMQVAPEYFYMVPPPPEDHLPRDDAAPPAQADMYHDRRQRPHPSQSWKRRQPSPIDRKGHSNPLDMPSSGGPSNSGLGKHPRAQSTSSSTGSRSSNAGRRSIKRLKHDEVKESDEPGKDKAGEGDEAEDDDGVVVPLEFDR